MGNWPVATWCFCLALTLIISIVELCKLWFWLAVSGTTSSTPTPTTPPSSASQPASSPPSPVPNSCLVSLMRTGCCCCCFSCFASLLCITDVAWTWVPYVFMEIPSCIHTVPGLRKVLETFVACIIFAFLSNTSLYLHQPALEWPLLHLLHPSSRGHATEAG